MLNFPQNVREYGVSFRGYDGNVRGCCENVRAK